MDLEFLEKIILATRDKPSLTPECQVKSITPIQEKFEDGWNHYLTLTPILLKSPKGNHFSTIRDNDFQEKLKEQTIRKLIAIKPELDLTNFDLLVLNKPINKVKIVKVNRVYNYASVCNVDIKCSKEVSEILSCPLIIIPNGGHLNGSSGWHELPEALESLLNIIKK